VNYEDEDYVRFYTRDTVSWRALGWEGQAVLSLMLHGKFDRSGVFDCDGHDPSHAVTIVTGLPVEVTSVGLKRLLDSRAWVERDGKLIWPKFIHAQTCRRSDKARQRESREKRRAEALGQPVTDCDQPSHAVTTGVPVVTNVSLSLAEQSRADPNQAEIPLPPLDGKPDPEPADTKSVDLSEETPIPANFQLHPGAVTTLSKALGFSEDVIREAVRDFVGYWTIGRGMGQARSHWQSKCRERIRNDKDSGKLAEIARKLGESQPGETNTAAIERNQARIDADRAAQRARDRAEAEARGIAVTLPVKTLLGGIGNG
jgi:hypothetical protein